MGQGRQLCGKKKRNLSPHPPGGAPGGTQHMAVDNKTPSFPQEPQGSQLFSHRIPRMPLPGAVLPCHPPPAWSLKLPPQALKGLWSSIRTAWSLVKVLKVHTNEINPPAVSNGAESPRGHGHPPPTADVCPAFLEESGPGVAGWLLSPQDWPSSFSET